MLYENIFILRNLSASKVPLSKKQFAHWIGIF